MKILLVGDSNFLIGIEDKKNKNTISLGNELASNLGENYSIANDSIWGSTICDYYVRSILNGPILHERAKIMVLGFGTNEANYYYSINSHVMNKSLHQELVEQVIKVILRATEVKKVLLAPVPPVYLRDTKRNQKINSQIIEFNTARHHLESKLKQIKYMSKIKYESKHIGDDGMHLSSQGIEYLSSCLVEYIIQEK